MKGEVDAGLRLWRQTVERLRNPDGEALGIDALGLEPWTCENQAAAVVAHAQARPPRSRRGHGARAAAAGPRAARRHPREAPVPGRSPADVRGAPAGARDGRPGSRQPHRRRVHHQDRGADDRRWPSASGTSGGSSRRCPRRGRGALPSTPTGRRTPTRCRLTPAWAGTSFGLLPWRCWRSGARDDVPRSARRVAVVELLRPEVTAQGDDRAPGDGEHTRCCRSACRASSPRTVSMIGVNGWYSANQRSAVGMRVGRDETAAQEGQEHEGHGQVARRLDAVGRPCPSATESQMSANEAIASTPNTASHSSGPAVGRNPSSTATPRTSAMPSIVWIRLPTTCPVSTETRAMAIVRNRAMMPSVMSIATDTAVLVAAPIDRDQQDSRGHVVEVLGPPAGDGRLAGRRRACRRTRRRTAAGRRSGARRASVSSTGSAACAGGCAAASWRSRAAA